MDIARPHRSKPPSLQQITWGQCLPQEVSTEVKQLSAQLFGEGDHHFQSVTAMGLQLGVDRRRVPELVQEMASTLCTLVGAKHRCFDACLTSSAPRSSCLRHFEFVMHDETPLPVELRAKPDVARTVTFGAPRSRLS